MNINQACLVSFVTALVGRQLTLNELHDLNDLVKACNEPNMITGPAIARMLNAIKQDHKIEAIREHRQMTGYGLKESKDEIEKYWPNMLLKG